MSYTKTYLNLAVKNYIRDLIAFFEENDLNYPLGSLDHFAFRLLNLKDYDGFLKFILPLSESAQFIIRDGRHLGTAKLLSAVNFGPFGKPIFVEFKESKPATLGHQHIGLDHTEILVADTEPFLNQLKAKNIGYEFQTGPFHKAAVLKINTLGQEVKITTQTLAQIIKQEYDAGNATKIK